MAIESALQKAIFDALDGVLSVPVYDEAPQEEIETDDDFPYVVIGDTDIEADNGDLGDSFEATTVINVWSRYRGRIETKNIQAEIFDVLHRADALTIDAPYTIFGVSFVDSSTVVEPDGVTRQGRSTFLINIDAPQGGE